MNPVRIAVTGKGIAEANRTLTCVAAVHQAARSNAAVTNDSTIAGAMTPTCGH